MITSVEEELYKIIHPVIQKSQVSLELHDGRINMDIIISREKINLINNLKTFIKSNLSNPSLSIIFSKHMSIVFSKILFKCLDDIDQNVRIASDECINLIIKLTSFSYSPYVIYNLFIEIKNSQSSRSLNGALQKFATLSALIKSSKRMSYVNNVLPVLKIILNRSEESVSLTLVETLPKIATNLFPYASDADIEKAVLISLLNALHETTVVSHQRNLANLIAITCFHMKNRKIYVEKLLRYFLTIDILHSKDEENELRRSLFVQKSLIVSSHSELEMDLEEFVWVLLSLIDILDGNSNASIKNLGLDCLLQLLLLTKSSHLWSFLHSERDENDENRWKSLVHDGIFEFDEEEEDEMEKLDETIASEENVSAESDLLGAPFEEREELFEAELSSATAGDVFAIDEYQEQHDGEEEEGAPSLRSARSDSRLCLQQDDSFIVSTATMASTGPGTDSKIVGQFGTFATWTGQSAMAYLVKVLIVEFLPENIPRCGDGDRAGGGVSEGRIRINSKVLAINCLSQICRMDYRMALRSVSILDGTICLPSAVDCVLSYCSDEDAQLSGSATLLLAQALRSHFTQLKYPASERCPKTDPVDCTRILSTIQAQINNPISGQHLKSVLSAVKLFLYDLSSTEYGPMAIDICESVLRYTDHNYKLVRKEILLICQVVDFRNLQLLATTDRGSGIIKKTTLARKFINAVLSLLADVEQDIREDACESLQFLITNGAFDREQLFCECSGSLHSNLSNADKSRLIPFLNREINVTLSDIRKKLRQNCNYHDSQATIHRAVHLIIERLLSNPVSSTKEMKLSLNDISGCIHALLMLHEKYPITTHSKVWMGQNVNDNSTLETRTLIGYCLSLLNTSLIISDTCLHTDLLCLISKLIFHGGLKHSLLNNLIVERPTLETGINTQLNSNLYLVSCIKQFMVHLCRIMNIYWHVFQFIVPSVPPHKTVLPNLSSQTHVSPGKKKTDSAPPKGSTDSQSTPDSRPPRTKSSLGYFVNESNYMLMYKVFSVAYNSYLISFDSIPHTDRLLNLLTQCLSSLGSIFEFLTFSEVSMHIEELLSYCTIFYNVLPTPTVTLIIKLLGSLFGTNIAAQWDPFLSQLFQQLFKAEISQVNPSDLTMNLIESWKNECIDNGSRLQSRLKTISISPSSSDTLQIYKWRQALSDTFLWIKASGKRREPGILRQIASTNSLHRPSLSHYIGLFEKHVFQCMRQYVVSSTELQTSIINLLCQLIYLRVNYCQLDSEQKFLNIIQNQLENFTSYNINDDKDASLIIKITEFLILISYEKAAGNRKDQPILNIAQVIRCIESLLINGVSVKPVIMSCMWQIVCDLFVHRAVWINNPGNFNLLPNSSTISEVEVQREAIIEFLLRKLIKYPETLEILALIVEHSAREQEMKWQKLSSNIWSRLSSALFEDSIEFSSSAHIDHFHRLICLLSAKVFTQQSINKGILDLVLKFDDNLSKCTDIYSPSVFHNYRLHIVQAVRSVICLQVIFIHDINYVKDYRATKLIIDLDDEDAIKLEFYNRIIIIFKIIVEFYNFMISNEYLRVTVDRDYLTIAQRLIKILLLIFIDIRTIENPGLNSDAPPEKNLEQMFSDMISMLDSKFIHLPDSDIHLQLLWSEFKLICDPSYHIDLSTVKRSPVVREHFCQNYVLQLCRRIVKLDGPILRDAIQQLIIENYALLTHLSQHKNVSQILHLINTDEHISIHFLDTFPTLSTQITSNTPFLMKWFDIIENVHFLASKRLISLLTDHIIAHPHNFSVIILMKAESVICSRIDSILDTKFDESYSLSLMETIKSLLKHIDGIVVPMPLLKRKIKILESVYERHLIELKVADPVLDPLVLEKIDSVEIDEKNFWKIYVEKSLKNHDQDIRLGPRLLQGGSANDLEQLFGIKIGSENTQSEMKSYNNDIISNLPPRFVQQCLRLGFLRSGGGMVQEGVRVDLIFRLGEKLVFEELNCVLASTKTHLKNEDFNKLSPTILVGLLAALNDYLSLSCQLSVPMPVSNDTSEKLISLIESLCICITKSNKLRSRLLVEELLMLITSCYGSSSLLTDEGIKFMGNNLTLENVSIIVNFLFLLVNQFSSNTLRGSMKYSMSVKGDLKNSTETLMILDKILKYYYSGQMDGSDTELQRKLKLSVISVARLPCVVMFTRNPKNIKEFDVTEYEKLLKNSSYKNLVELDCLSRLNRDDLTSAQTIINSLGWTSRFMFEESWLLFLDLLHDKGPVSDNTENSTAKPSLSSEEVVEQGHCDSLGLLGLTDLILQTTARPNPGNPVVAQLEHKTRDKTPNLLHTKTGRKLCTIHVQLEEEIFHCHRGFRMLSAGWTITSWNLEREDSVLKYRHDQININVLAKRISIGSRSPQISGSSSNNLDVLSCLQSLPIICKQWLDNVNDNGKRKSVAPWPRACALRCAVMLMDLFSSREQVQWLLDSILELYKSMSIEDDWITTSWMCIGMSKCVAVLETSSNLTLPLNSGSGKPPNAISTSSIYGLPQSLKLIESCLSSDLTILQQSALHSAMSLLQMMVYGKNTWDLPTGSLVELRNVHDMVMRYLENQLLILDSSHFNTERRMSLSDQFNVANPISNSNALSQVMSTGAASIASTVSGFASINNVNAPLGLMNTTSYNSLSYFAPNSLPRLFKSTHGISLRTERHDYLVMATACFYCERYPDALPESDILNNFVSLSKNIMQLEKKRDPSPQLLLTMCRCLERISLTQRISIIVTEQIIRLCGNFLKSCKSTTHSLPVLGLFLTSCYLSLANSNVVNTSPAVFETMFYNGPSNSSGENQLVMLERVNLFWKRLTDADTMDAVESRILSRLISNIMTDFMSGEELLNKTIHQLLRSWPRSQCVAKTLFDVITKCLNQTDGEKLIRKWTLLVLQSLTSCRPDNLSVWATTIVLVASGSSFRSCLRALFSQCLDWLTRFERGDHNMAELETILCLAAIAFLQDMGRDPSSEVDNKLTFLKAMQSSSNIPAFQKFFSIAREKHLL